MKHNVEKLKEISIFKNFSETMIQEFAGFFKQTEYNKNDIIFKEGSEGDMLFIIVSGEVTIEKCLDKKGLEFKTLAFLGKGEFFGEMAVMEGQVRFAQAKASKISMLYAIKRSEFFTFIKKYPETGIGIFTEIMKVSLQRLQHTSDELTMLFDMSKLLMQENKSASTFIKKTVEEITLHLKGSWNINGYMYNRFDKKHELIISKESFIETVDSHSLKGELKSGWIGNSSYVMNFSAQDKPLGYIIFTKSKELSNNEKNNLSTIFDTVSFILNSTVANINYWTDAMIKAVEKGLITPSDED
ncbi:MAG: cyclic nucleotide-binding domain-containing protein [Elusimicrobiales bacterium]|nr:cyclic nucleotide-binding domain-containing protein [Elusimicrobiales bacterium]MCK5357033.1 cyclic nucleotide-binding domain-containing protein [Elusimicrobiales bacterium]